MVPVNTDNKHGRGFLVSTDKIEHPNRRDAHLDQFLRISSLSVSTDKCLITVFLDLIGEALKVKYSIF